MNIQNEDGCTSMGGCIVSIFVASAVIGLIVALMTGSAETGIVVSKKIASEILGILASATGIVLFLVFLSRIR